MDLGAPFYYARAPSDRLPDSEGALIKCQKRAILSGYSFCYLFIRSEKAMGAENQTTVAYAVVRTGGKQYRVSVGQTLKVESLVADVGSELVLSEVLALGLGAQLDIGRPVLEGASVKARVVSHGRGDKIRIFKHRRRKHYAKTQGHRQNYTEIAVESLVRPDGSQI
jgi:large subunit ribosomal protein L21